MANGQETGIETLRAVIARQARRNDWNSVREFHQGQRSTTALKGRIHDRTPTRLPKHQKALADRGPSIHDRGEFFSSLLMVLFGAVRNHARHAGLNLGIKERVVQVVRTLRAGIVNDDLR